MRPGWANTGTGPTRLLATPPPLGVFVSEIGRLNEVLYIWVYDSLADREERRAKLDADPAWHEFRRGNRGTFVQQDVKIMRYASFSPQ